MKEMLSSVSERGQVTIPLEIRRALDIKPRDKVAFKLEGGEVKLIPSTSTLEASYQAIPRLRRPLTDDETTEIAAEEHAETILSMPCVIGVRAPWLSRE
jgi:AbrB family looped-hinge helix DNA binding protein